MLIKHLKVSGLLSFGPKGIDLPLRNLNVLIGPNGSGKSNLLEVINLFRAAPSPRSSISGPVMEGGGVDEWLWKGGNQDEGEPVTACMSCEVVGRKKDESLRHTIEFTSARHGVSIKSESIAWVDKPDTHPIFSLSDFGAQFENTPSINGERQIRIFEPEELDSSASILAQIRDPGRYEVFEYLEKQYSSIQLYRDWCFGPHAGLRSASKSDGRTDALTRGGENLALMVASMPSAVEKRLITELQTLYADIEAIKARPMAGGSLQLFLTEAGGIDIPASRLSDGTLRFLSLLIILLDAKPPPLIVIEEPELGLHPDVIPQLAKLLMEASERTQLIVTTHSRMLIDALGDDPEAVIVCEKRDGESVFERLNGERMAIWLEQFSLGDLWSKGELGGNRW